MAHRFVVVTTQTYQHAQAHPAINRSSFVRRAQRGRRRDPTVNLTTDINVRPPVQMSLYRLHNRKNIVTVIADRRSAGLGSAPVCPNPAQPR